MTRTEKVFIGPVIHSLSLTHLEILPLALIEVSQSGIITKVLPIENEQSILDIQSSYNDAEIQLLTRTQFLIPGLIDTHTHAPQSVNCGLGLDKPLLEWLSYYTFPTESQFHNTQIASKIYPSIIKNHLLNGTTTCCYYGTIHLESTLLLARLCEELGQRGYIGKINMNRNCPESLKETTKQSLEETELFIRACLKYELVKPVMTPRFAPSCDDELLLGLGRLAKKYDVMIQSHLSENPNEIEWVKTLFPQHDSYTEVYDSFGLLSEKTIMGHCIYLSKHERQLLKQRGVGVSHCPISNFNISSGICNVRLYLEEGLKVGLGSDISAGHCPSMLEVMRQAILASKVLCLPKKDEETNLPLQSEQSLENDVNEKAQRPLSIGEVFYLCTMGGASVLGLEDTIGNFMVGKSFDALIVDVGHLQERYPSIPSCTDFTSSENEVGGDLKEMFEKFIYLGDDRHIHEVYVQGRLVKP